MRIAFRSIAALAVLLAASCKDSTPPRVEGPGVPARMDIVSGHLQEGTVGRELANPIVVKVLNAQGRPVANRVVNFVVTRGGGSVFAGAAQTNADGIAQERWTLGTSTADSQKVEVRAVDQSTGAPLVFDIHRGPQAWTGGHGAARGW